MVEISERDFQCKSTHFHFSFSFTENFFSMKIFSKAGGEHQRTEEAKLAMRVVKTAMLLAVMWMLGCKRAVQRVVHRPDHRGAPQAQEDRQRPRRV